MAEAGIERVVALISDDAEVKAAAKALALQALEQASYLLHYGNDTTQMRIIGAMLPAFQKSLTEDKTKGSDLDQMKQNFQSLRGAIMGDDDEEAVTDH